MAISLFSGVSSAFSAVFEVFGNIVKRKFGREVGVIPVGERKMPPAEEIFGRKSLQDYKVKVSEQAGKPLSPTASFSKKKSKLVFEEVAPRALRGMHDFTKKGYRSLIGKKTDKGTKLIQQELAEYEQLWNKSTTVKTFEEKLARIQKFAKEYLEQANKVATPGKALLNKKQVMEDLIETTKLEYFRYGLDNHSTGERIDHFIKILVETPETAIQYFQAIGPEASLDIILRFQKLADTSDYNDPVTPARQIAEDYVKTLKPEELKLFSGSKQPETQSEEVIRKKAIARITEHLAGSTPGLQDKINQAKLVHFDYQDNTLSMAKLHNLSSTTISITGRELNDGSGAEMLNHYNPARSAKTNASANCPDLRHINLQDLKQCTEAGYALWLDILLSEAKFDSDFKNFLLLYDQIYDAKANAKWLEEIKNEDANSRILMMEDTEVVDEGSKLTPELVKKIEQARTPRARENIFKTLGWPYPEQATHPSTPFIRAIEARYPVNK